MAPHANFLAEPGRLDFRSVEEPRPGSDEIIVDIAVALTDGTDLKAFRRGHPKIAMPGPFGHEFAGVVSAVGERAGRWRVGDRIVSAHTAPCNECRYCRGGQPNLCDRFLDNITMGAYAEKMRLPKLIHSQNAFRVPPDVTFERAACLEPLACVVHGQRVVAHDGFSGRKVLIVGAGAIGLMHLMLAKRRGATEVVVLGHRPDRLALALQLGAALATHEIDTVRERFAPCGPDVVLECAGTIDAWEMAFDLVRPGGHLLLFGGTPSGSRITLDAAKLHYGEVTIKGCFHFTPDDVARAFEYIVEGQLPLECLITHRLPLSRLGDAFEGMTRREGMKYAIIPDQHWSEPES